MSGIAVRAVIKGDREGFEAGGSNQLQPYASRKQPHHVTVVDNFDGSAFVSVVAHRRQQRIPIRQITVKPKNLRRRCSIASGHVRPSRFPSIPRGCESAAQSMP